MANPDISARVADYDKLRPDLRTGDIVLFSSDGIFARVIKLASRSKWSHVGMVVHVESWDLVLLWESNTKQAITDIDSGDHFVGVQLVALSQKIREYKGRIAVRKLSKELSASQITKLADFRKNAARKVKYESNYFELIKAALDDQWENMIGQNSEDLSNFFCSELVAEALQQIGLLRDGQGEKPSNEFVPGDFASDAKQPLALLDGYSLSDEIVLG